jgi:Plant transposon protein
MTLTSSPFFNAIRAGRWPPTRPEATLSEFKLDWFYFLADGIYPRFRIFVPSLPRPQNLKEKLFSKHQEGARKSVERVFGVLFRQFQILYTPSRLWDKEDMTYIVETCCILHNMVVNSRRAQYSGTRKVRIPEEETRIPTGITRIRNPVTLDEC